MKILLFGEYSGLFNCLKDGLVALGHDVFLASDGNSYRDYPSDFRWDAHTKGKLKKLHAPFCATNIWLHKNLFRGFDVVYLVAPNFISTHNWLNRPIYEYLFKHNKKVYLCGAGIGALLFDFWYDSDTKYHHYMQGYFEERPNPTFYHNESLRQWEDYLLKKVDGYIPIWYEYAEPYRKYESIRKTIRIPINVKQFEYKPNIVKDKIVFYHGVTRPCKGTRFIRPAFEKMQKAFGDKAEFICAEKLPFKEYMKVVERTNIIVDDANSYSIAMNGLFSLLKGKLIMGGAEPIANKELGIDGVNPVFNICPDVDQICSVIEDIISRKDEIEGLGLKGRQFVEKYHDYIDIAQEYVTLWENDLNNL